MTNSIDTREVSYFCLKRILEDGATIEGAIVQVLKQKSAEITLQDKGFIRHLVTTTLRRLGQLDRIIDHMTKKKLVKGQMPVKHILRLGLAQLYFCEVPSHAAVNSTVNLMDTVVDKKLAYMKKPVNAILRNAIREKETLLKKFGNSRLNLPKWLLKSWDDSFGEKNVKEIINVILSEPPLDITLKKGLYASEWAEILDGEKRPDGGVRILKAGRIEKLSGFDAGNWWVQDMAATIPARLLCANSRDHVLDLCAAPGGKTAQSADAGSKVTAVDLSRSRLSRLKENMERLKLDVDVVTSNVLDYVPENKVDYILLDAPCSSTGTIRRHPEILHTRSENEIMKMAALQEQMLDHASSLLNKGGTLIYSVCSMQKEEGVDQIKALLKRDRSLQRKEVIMKEVPGLETAILANGDVQTLPHHYEGGVDGFFISRLVKS